MHSAVVRDGCTDDGRDALIGAGIGHEWRDRVPLSGEVGDDLIERGPHDVDRDDVGARLGDGASGVRTDAASTCTCDDDGSSVES
ncbi:unannotated protein [freshwater metagenome]|uniref:Unannotated protein n=1 Tax=freshwater metagenome TaxID=449393 RepID=A0A6J7ALI1_9ZZZZ